jgi:hypothetical protein
MNMNISSKVALLATLPAAAILFFGMAAIFYYKPTIEAEVNILSSIATTVTVLFLISERLRESARHKLEFLNRRALTPALKVGKNGIITARAGEAVVLQQCIELLKHHGRFLRVRLYPKNLIRTIDTAKDSMFAYDKSYEKLLTTANKTFGQTQFSVLALLVVLGILAKGDHEESTLEIAKGHLESLKKTDPELIEEFSRNGSKVASDIGQIKKQIEEFFVENQLEEKSEKEYFHSP